MNEPRSRATMKVVVRILVILAISAASLVIAQRVLTGFDASVDGMPVVRGHVEDGTVDVEALPEWQGDAEVTLHYDDGTVDYAFGRRVEGELVIATIEHGAEPLEAFLARLGLASNEFALASACELMTPDDAYFDEACAPYDPRRRPTDHPDVAGDVCSTCHLPNEIEEAYERSRGIVLAVATDTVASPDRAMPAGHVEVQGKACSSCHTVAGDDVPAAPVGGSGRPPGHPDVAAGSCSTCHGGGDTPIGDRPVGGVPSPDQPRPPGHPDVAAGSCATCHGGTADTPTVPTLPNDHPSTGGQACTSCHDSPTGPSDDDEDDHERDDYDEHDDDDREDEDEGDEHEDDEHDDD